MLDLWSSFQKVAFGEYYNKPLLLSTGERKHTSLNMIKERSIEITPSRSTLQTYSEGLRYIVASSLTFDLFVSVYDVNSRTVIAFRPTRDLKEKDWLRIAHHLSLWKKPNIEIRAFGFQNGSNEMPHLVEEFYKRVKVGRFMEIDLFGTDVRHISIDLKTGVSYNVFMQNRIYRAGELTNQMTRDDFGKTRSDLVVI